MRPRIRRDRSSGGWPSASEWLDPATMSTAAGVCGDGSVGASQKAVRGAAVAVAAPQQPEEAAAARRRAPEEGAAVVEVPDGIEDMGDEALLELAMS